MTFEAKTVLITGASSGIGAALARELARDASTLVLVARRQPMLETLRGELVASHPRLTVLVRAMDITDPAQQRALQEELTHLAVRVDVLINNAGIGDQALFHAAEPSRLQTIIDVNVGAVTSLTHLFSADFVRDPAGKAVVFVGSGAGVTWMPGNAVYSASKHYITALAMNLHAEWKPLGIQVALILPGPVDSEFDQHANTTGGMVGGPSQKTRITAKACAVDSLRQIRKGQVVVIPGTRIRLLLKFYMWLPWKLRQRIVENEGRKLVRAPASRERS